MRKNLTLKGYVVVRGVNSNEFFVCRNIENGEN